jgi:hypothetical protein
VAAGESGDPSYPVVASLGRRRGRTLHLPPREQARGSSAPRRNRPLWQGGRWPGALLPSFELRKVGTDLRSLRFRCQVDRLPRSSPSAYGIASSSLILRPSAHASSHVASSMEALAWELGGALGSLRFLSPCFPMPFRFGPFGQYIPYELLGRPREQGLSPIPRREQPVYEGFKGDQSSRRLSPQPHPCAAPS